ncbi:alkylation response protein AidB-like acyl-CoA dehydrogenase [Pseudomonas laurylsulfativorans]|uniref:acyl-CoA dehydrogenase family protein n=1 Tax=Pseudomonas laurylsulfativorans TaxID=1943631 RepID=UPI0020A04DF8|nr:acyl-CoA dehydrogenase family protein [Pseudomonas laurylsulfativorans]MCP1419139.1 alkylation response protein AidB-like acyl-CoA dehydrogenase [Pseudomonas laurylsulfativorans]
MSRFPLQSALAKGFRMDVQRTIYREDHEMFRTTVRRFLERDYLPGQVQGEAVGRRVWQKAARQGLLCVTLPAEFGGGGDFGHAAVICEEFARAGIDDKSLSLHSDIIAPCILRLGNDEQKRRWLPPACSGETILALAIAEPGGRNRNLRTHAVHEGDHCLINGSKVAVGNGMSSHRVLLACRTETSEGDIGVSLFMVETDRAGVTRTPSAQANSQPGDADFCFADVRVPMANQLGEAGRGMDYLGRAWGQERLLLAIHAASRLEHLLKQTLDHVQQADSSGYCPWDVPHTRIKMADIKARAVALRVLVDFYLQRRMQQALSAEHTAIANLYASETLRKCTEELSRLRMANGRLRTHSLADTWIDHGGTGKAAHEIIALAL